MTSLRKHLSLSRQEATLVLALVLLLSTLMFSVGVFVGYGAGQSVVVKGGHPAENAELAVHEETSKGRAPASVTDADAGERLKKNFADSKQRALMDFTDDQAAMVSEPPSIADSEAHFNSNKGWDRRPSSAEVSATEKLEKAVESEDARRKAGPPTGVKTLFERSPSSIQGFEPTIGSYTVQVASFATADEAAAKVVDLRKAGMLDAYSQAVQFKNGETWHRVAVGSYPNPMWARKMGDRLVKRSLSRDFVVREVK
jgi:cell division septation protein DedD